MKHIPNITIKAIDHKDQRYETCGDWIFEPDGSIIIYVSKMKNWKYELAVAIHEMIEVLDCKENGVSQETVDKFDKDFEKMRDIYPDIIGLTEPGDMKAAPYFLSHQMATEVERKYIYENALNWDEYEREVNSL